MLIRSVNLSQLSHDSWVLQTHEGRHLKINRATALLVKILQSEPSTRDAVRVFNSTFSTSINEITFNKLIQNKFTGYNILQWENDSKLYRKGQYLFLKIPLLSSKISAILARPFSWLFKENLFWGFMIFFALLSVVVLFLFYPLNFSRFNNANFILFILLVYFSTFIHELGHISACKVVGVSHGEIGFGFYLLFPVLYTDVTNIWMVNKKKRLVVNLAGVANEWFYATLLLCLFLVCEQELFLAAFYTIVIKSVFELNPFMRMDGYWTLSDLTDTPNLLTKSNSELKSFFARLLKFNLSNLNIGNRRSLNLIVYAFLNNFISFFYCLYILFSHFEIIASFPVILKDLFVKVIYREIK